MTVSDCIIVRTTLKDMLKSLPAEKFVQVHKSFIINLTNFYPKNFSPKIFFYGTTINVNGRAVNC